MPFYEQLSIILKKYQVLLLGYYCCFCFFVYIIFTVGHFFSYYDKCQPVKRFLFRYYNDNHICGNYFICFI